jgi:hypothetical protein
MDSRELEMLRQRMAFLEQTLERCMEHIAALESRVASLEMRPVAFAPTEELVAAVAQRVAAMSHGPHAAAVLTGREDLEKVREEWEIARLRRKK